MRRAATFALLVTVGCGSKAAAPTTYSVGELECLEPRGLVRDLEFDLATDGADAASNALAGWFERIDASITTDDVSRAVSSPGTDAAPAIFVRETGARRTAEFRVEELGQGWFVTGFSICHEDRELLGSEVRG